MRKRSILSCWVGIVQIKKRKLTSIIIYYFDTCIRHVFCWWFLNWSLILKRKNCFDPYVLTIFRYTLSFVAYWNLAMITFNKKFKYTLPKGWKLFVNTHSIPLPFLLLFNFLFFFGQFERFFNDQRWYFFWSIIFLSGNSMGLVWNFVGFYIWSN